MMKKVRKYVKMKDSRRKERFARKNNTRGITLIALVVTIVVLIILATISINVVLRRKWTY